MNNEKVLWVVRVSYNKFTSEPEALWFDVALSSEKGYETKHEALSAFCEGEERINRQLKREGNWFANEEYAITNDCQFCSHLTYNKEEKYFVCPFEDYDPINPCKHFVKGDKDNFAEKNKEAENE